MIRVRRRSTTQSASLLVLAVLVMTSVLSPVDALASTIATKQAEMAQLSSTLAQQQKTSEITSNEYDGAKARLQNINANIAVLGTEEAQKRTAIVVTSRELVTAVVRAYVLGAADTQIQAIFNQNVTKIDSLKVFEDVVTGNLTQIRNEYQRQKRSLDGTIAQVASQRSKAQNQIDTMQALLAQNIRNENATQAALASASLALKGQIITYEVRVGMAAAQARNVSAEESATSAASAVGGQNAANRVLAAIQAATPPAATGPIVSGRPAGSAQGMAALHAAIREIGVPYVWGGETPGVGFDCSGLVQWAWDQAGFSIPRTTESQYPALHRVPLNALQPGDLLFYYNLDGDNQIDHVVMYAGSGPFGANTIIAAAHAGTNVSYAPLFTFGLQGAARP